MVKTRGMSVADPVDAINMDEFKLHFLEALKDKGNVSSHNFVIRRL